MCARWGDLRAFAEDVSPRPSLAHVLHRKDSDMDYTAENFEWMTKKEHAMHHRHGRYIVVDGIRGSIGAAAKRVGITRRSAETPAF